MVEFVKVFVPCRTFRPVDVENLPDGFRARKGQLNSLYQVVRIDQITDSVSILPREGPRLSLESLCEFDGP